MSDQQSDRRAQSEAAFEQRGLEQGAHIHEFMPEFTLDDLKSALFASTYSAPQPLPVNLDDAAATLRVVVVSVTQIYIARTVEVTDGPLGCYEHPSWRIEGWLMKSGFDPYDEVVRVRIVIDTKEALDEWDQAYIQRVPGTESIPL